jgi:hypothetical protein
MSFLNPEFKITILPFNSNEGQEYDLPRDMVGSITSSRTLQGNSISMTIPNGLRNISGLKRFKQVFTDQCIVRLYVRKNPSEEFRQLNVGYMNGLSVNVEAMGKLNWSIQFLGLEQKLQKQELFIDMDTSSQNSINEQSKNGSSYEGAFSKIFDALSSTIGMKKLLIGIWDNVIYGLVGKYKESDPAGFTYGGYELIGKWNGNQENSNALMSSFFAEGYYEDTTTQYKIFSQNQIGSSPRFWEVLTSMATQPLYECFLDTLDTNEKRVSNGLTITDSILDDATNQNYTVASAGVTSLVFRKTPFDYLFDLQGEWNTDKDFQEVKHISSMSFTENPDDIYSGCHVGSTESKLAGKSSTLLFAVKWSDVLKRRYGYRVMQVKIDGLTYDYEETATKTKLNQIDTALASIQNKLFTIFFPVDNNFVRARRTYLKNVTASVNCAFDYYRIGTALDMGEHELIDFYGRYGYVTGVTDSFNPMGQATTSLQLKWIDNKEDLLPKF